MTVANLNQAFSKIAVSSPVSLKSVSSQSAEFIPSARIITDNTSGKYRRMSQTFRRNGKFQCRRISTIPIQASLDLAIAEM